MITTVEPATPNDLYHEAQRLIALGQPVFPCRGRGDQAKAPMTQRGLHDATLDRDRIKRWLKSHPQAALGIPTGIRWDVLDVDIKESADGRMHLPTLNELGLLDGCQRVVQTPSGGWHLYFPAHPSMTNRANVQIGMDVRGKGGYVLAPPSYIESGTVRGSYIDHGETDSTKHEPLRWKAIVNSLAPVDDLTQKPIDLLPSERRSSLAALREWLSNRVAGERNNALHWAVCRCIESNIDPNELTEVALLIGLTEEETSKTISHALRRAGLTAAQMDSEEESIAADMAQYFEPLDGDEAA